MVYVSYFEMQIEHDFYISGIEYTRMTVLVLYRFLLESFLQLVKG